jgi:hypothetical protein
MLMLPETTLLASSQYRVSKCDSLTMTGLSKHINSWRTSEWIWGVASEFVNAFQFGLKLEKGNGLFTWRASLVSVQLLKHNFLKNFDSKKYVKCCRGLYCILASCYIRLTLNICSFVNNQHGGRKDNTIILTNGQLAISTTTGEAHV